MCLNEELVDVCLGRVKADLVLKCKSLLNVFSGEILEDTVVAVKRDKIAYVGKKADHMIGVGTNVLKIREGVAVPGFIDAHTHLDLFCSPTEQAKAILAHGSTALFAEPDELTNVMGFEGFKIFVKEVEKLPLKVYVTMPLAVPQDPELSSIKPLSLNAYKAALSWDNVVGLGEAIAWTLIINNDSYYVRKFDLALKEKKTIEGHTAGARDAKLAACICSGVSSCHEAIDVEQAVERLRLGLFLMIREGSIRRDLAQILRGLISRGVDLDNSAIVTDGVDPVDLVELGHMDYIVKMAVEHGLDPVKAVQMVTLNPAKHFKMDNIIGAIAPARYADITVLESLRKPKILLTISNGVVAAKNGQLRIKLKPHEYPKEAFETMKVNPLKASMFKIKAPILEGEVKVLTAKLESEIITRKEEVKAEVVNGEVKLEREPDMAKVAVIDRHFKSGRVGLGIVKGFGAKVGAIASSINIDDNQLLVLGCNDGDMTNAANKVADLGGGIVIFHENKLLEALQMPIAGIMSNESLETTAVKLRKLNDMLARLGSPFNKPLNAILFLTFVTLPEIRFTDKGIVDVKNRCYAPLFIQV